MSSPSKKNIAQALRGGGHIAASFVTVLCLGALASQSAYTQIGNKGYVQLQGATPGVSQSGHANISGTMRAGVFAGNGSALSGIPWTALTGVPTTFLPGGTASGDLGQSYPNPIVDGLQGRAVSATAPTANQVLTWNGSAWVPGTPSSLTLPFSGNMGSASALFTIDNSGTGTGGVFRSTSGTGLSAEGAVSGVSGSTNTSGGSAVYGKSTNPLAFAGRFDGRIRVTDKAGFGTADPLEAVHILGNLRIDNGDIRSWGGIDLRPDIDLTGDDIVRFLNNAGAEQIRMDANGNFAIGVNSAAVDLAIGDSDTGWQSGGDGVLNGFANNLISFSYDQNHTRIGREGVPALLAFGGPGTLEYIASERNAGANAYGIDITTSGVPRLSVRNDGKVGIGTQTPDVPLRVIGRAKVDILEITGAGDLAEQFVTEPCAKPGMLMEIDPESGGQLRLSRSAYSRLVAGVVSGAKGLKAGVILDPQPGVKSQPIALSGRVWVFCDATENAIEPGQFLVASQTPGYAMAGTDVSRLSGATIGKAMSRLAKGQTGLVLVLVSLQ